MRSTFDIDKDVHHSFKKACLDAGKSMTEVMVEMMKEFVKKQEVKK